MSIPYTNSLWSTYAALLTATFVCKQQSKSTRLGPLFGIRKNWRMYQVYLLLAESTGSTDCPASPLYTLDSRVSIGVAPIAATGEGS